MSRDHMLGFPALLHSLEESGSRSPRYGLGVPNRAYDEAQTKATARFEQLRHVIDFEEGDHTPEWMRTPQTPLKWPPLPDAEGWIKWEGGEQPVGGIVAIRLRCGVTGAGISASHVRWDHIPFVDDLVAYRVVEQ